MQVGRTHKKYDVTLTEKDVEILIECIQKAKMENYRNVMYSQGLLDDFVGIFLDENKENYVNRYIELVGIYLKSNHEVEPDKIVELQNKTREKLEDERNFVFHYDPEDWAKRLFETECNCVEDIPRSLIIKRMGIIDNDDVLELDNEIEVEEEPPYHDFFNFINRATIVEGKYADEIRESLLRKPSPTALARNKKAQDLLHKLRK